MLKLGQVVPLARDNRFVHGYSKDESLVLLGTHPTNPNAFKYKRTEFESYWRHCSDVIDYENLIEGMFYEWVVLEEPLETIIRQIRKEVKSNAI